MKEYKNVINPRIIYLDEDEDTPPEHKIPPPKLHLQGGNALYTRFSSFRKNALTSWKIDIFQQFLKHNISRIYGIHSLGKISAGINDGLDMEPEAAAGVDEKRAGQISNKVVHFGNEWFHDVMRQSVDIPFGHAP